MTADADQGERAGGGPLAEYTRRRDARREAVRALEQRAARISNFRLWSFLLTCGLLAAAWWSDELSGGWAAIPGVLFLGLVVRHEAIHRALARAARAVTYYEDGLARLDGSWPGRGVDGLEHASEEHPYAADLDLFGDQFFAFHERGGVIDGVGLVDIWFDNAMFLLNAIDSLAGDESLVALRKRRSKYRRLTKIDELTEEAVDQKETEVKNASERAEAELAQAKAALEAKVKQIQEREGVDETTKAVLIQSAEDAENRRLNAKTERIEREKARAITRAEAELARKVDDQQNKVRLFAVLVPPIPALLLGALIFGRRRRRERDAIPAARKKRGAA